MGRTVQSSDGDQGRKRGADVLRPVSPENADDETFEGPLILRPEGRMFFLNVQA